MSCRERKERNGSDTTMTQIIWIIYLCLIGIPFAILLWYAVAWLIWEMGLKDWVKKDE